MSNPFSTPSQTSFREAHAHADTDLERNSMHHTLGDKPVQAAPGNHKHEGVYLEPGSLITDFVPLWTASSGPALTVGTNGFRYRDVDGVITFQMQFTITNLNGGTGNVQFTVPFNAIGNHIIHGREDGLTGKTLQGRLGSTTNIVTVRFYDNTSALAVNHVILMSGSYLKAV